MTDGDPKVQPGVLGGFFGLDLPAASGGGFLALWRARDRRRAFGNARSAFRALVDRHPEARVWLPAFICREMAAAVPSGRLGFYGVGSALSPDVDKLSRETRSGDVVLVVNYFGAPPPPSVVSFAASRADLVFVEDGAQTVDAAIKPWADWRLFSPRKVTGVADGGILVPVSRKAYEIWAEILARPPDDAVATMHPALARFEDEDEQDNTAWYELHRRKEDGAAVTSERMSRLSWRMLELLDPQMQGDARRRNHRALLGPLRDWAFQPDPAPSHVPFGFPVEVPAERRHALLRKLYACRIFPAIHWADLPSPAAEFPAEHSLANRILTLPCDHRYGEKDMARLADMFLAALK